MNNIRYTKKRLTYTFFGGILSLIFLLGFSFFTFRFFDEYRKDNNDALLLKNQELFAGKEFLKNIQDQKRKEFKKLPRQGKFGKRNPPPFLVHFDSVGNIKEKDFGAEFENEAFILDLYKNYSNQSNFHSKYGIGQFYTTPDGDKLMVFKPFRYPIFEWMEDVFVFSLFMFLFSFPLYFIIKLFVDSTLLPVEQNLRDMEDFVHNAGHELKTPLAVIHSDLQLMKLKKIYNEESVSEMIQEIDKLNITIEGLVDLADIHDKMEREEIDIEREIQHILKTYEVQIQEKSLEVDIQSLSKVRFSAHKGYVHIFLSNLISNAIKYNKVGGNLFFELSKQKLIIRDSGIGIPFEHHSKIWQRFYKVASSHGENKGRGIGLSLVKKIADIYNWKLDIKSESGKGTAFIIKW